MMPQNPAQTRVMFQAAWMRGHVSLAGPFQERRLSRRKQYPARARASDAVK
jgi:hypothetical protein